MQQAVAYRALVGDYLPSLDEPTPLPVPIAEPEPEPELPPAAAAPFVLPTLTELERLVAAAEGAKPERTEEFGKDSFFKRPAQPREIAPVYVFLASSLASYVTGEVYGVTGRRMPL